MWSVPGCLALPRQNPAAGVSMRGTGRYQGMIDMVGDEQERIGLRVGGRGMGRR